MIRGNGVTLILADIDGQRCEQLTRLTLVVKKLDRRTGVFIDLETDAPEDAKTTTRSDRVNALSQRVVEIVGQASGAEVRRRRPGRAGSPSYRRSRRRNARKHIQTSRTDWGRCHRHVRECRKTSSRRENGI